MSTQGRHLLPAAGSVLTQDCVCVCVCLLYFVCTDDSCKKNNPCQNGGTCVDGNAEIYTVIECICKLGWVGDYCEIG